MIQKKICLLGSFSVGKTSLIQRYVNSIFSDKYLTTVGVKIDRKEVQLDDTRLNLMIWDIAGEDEFSSIRPAHLRGLSGYIIVIDGTRQNSFDVALSIHHRVQETIGQLPMVFALNKSDLKEQWALEAERVRELGRLGYPVLETSAKLDQGVEEVFLGLARQLVPAAV
ncbi:MAG: Rab family GTPase [Thiolinea sp.]